MILRIKYKIFFKVFKKEKNMKNIKKKNFLSKMLNMLEKIFLNKILSKYYF